MSKILENISILNRKDRANVTFAMARQLYHWTFRKRYPQLMTASEANRRSREAPLLLPTSPNPSVSIIIPVYGQIGATWSCLSSLVRTHCEQPYEVIVVDDASPDCTSEVMSRVRGLTVYTNPKNLGFIGACNAGASQARGRWLCFLNNDTSVSDYWLDELVQTFELHPDTGLVGAKLVFADGRLQEAGATVFRDGTGFHFGRNRDPMRPEYCFVREVDYASGACLLLERSLFESLGGFDTHYTPAYYEDTDLAFRIRQKGLRVRYQPRAEIVHHEGISHGRDENQGLKRYQMLNRSKLVERWQSELLQSHPPPSRRTYEAAMRQQGPRWLVVGPSPVSDFEDPLLPVLSEVLHTSGRVAWIAPHAESQGDPRHAALQRQGIEVLYAPYYPSAAGVLRSRRAQSLTLVWLRDPPTLNTFLSHCVRFAPHVKVIVEFTKTYALPPPPELSRTHEVVVRDSSHLTELQKHYHQIPMRLLPSEPKEITELVTHLQRRCAMR